MLWVCTIQLCMMISCETTSYVSRAFVFYCFVFYFMDCVKNILSPLVPSMLCVSHIKQSKGTAALAYVLTVCTHIICHPALSVITACWGHQHPRWERLCCIMCRMHHSSAAAPRTDLKPPAISQHEQAICRACKVVQPVSLIHCFFTLGNKPDWSKTLLSYMRIYNYTSAIS